MDCLEDATKILFIFSRNWINLTWNVGFPIPLIFRKNRYLKKILSHHSTYSVRSSVGPVY